jgi:hypothetical protein
MEREPSPKTQPETEQIENPEIERRREECWQKLEKAEIVEEKEDGSIVIDLEKIDKTKSAPGDEVVQATWPLFHYKKFEGHSNIHTTLLEIFKDKKVISRADWEDGEREGRDLYYLPETPEAAFDIEAIRSSRFYIPLWDKRYKHEWFTEKTLPTKDGQEVRLDEASAACLVYHPEYGDGQRDQYGILTVSRNGKREKISGTFFKEALPQYGRKPIGPKTREAKYEYVASPATYTAEFCLDLIGQGLLEPSDFMGGAKSEDNLRFRHERKLDPSKRHLEPFIHGYRFYIDAQTTRDLRDRIPEGGSLKFVELSEKYAGIIISGPNSEDEITHIITIPQELAPEKITYLGKSETEIERYNPARWQRKRADESEQSYYQRVRLVEDYQTIANLTYELYRRDQINLASFSMREHQAIATAFKSAGDEEEFLDFVSGFGKDGLLAFSACEYNNDHGKNLGDTVIELAREADPEQVKNLLGQLREASEMISIIANKIKQEGTLKNIEGISEDDFLFQLEESMMRRLKDLILAAHQQSTEPKEEAPNLEEITTALRGVNKLLEVVYMFNEYNQKELYSHEPNKEEIGAGYLVEDEEGYSYKLKLLIRPEEQLDKKGEVIAEARVNLVLDFDAPRGKINQKLFEAFEQSISRAGKEPEVSHQLRIGFDLDTFYITEQGQPFFSLDFGSSRYQSETFSRTGDILGNALALVSQEGSHNIDSFTHTYSDRRVFAQIANSIRYSLVPEREQNPKAA